MNIVLLLFIIAGVIQLMYYAVLMIYWNRQPVIKPALTFPKVSIVICARNEAENLEKNLPVVLQQDYPDFEVLVVNDGSEDETEEILKKNKSEISILKSITISPEEKIGSGKKYALQKGIQAASGEVILLTDADCIPASADWIKCMVRSLGEQKIVLGISPYRKESSVLNSLAEYETALTAWQYISYCHAGIPYMGVGRNLCFYKDVFLQKKWTAEEMMLPSGDDDLFIQSMSNSGNTTTCSDKNSFTYSTAPASWKSWFRQKKRHLATGYHYSMQHRFLLGTFLASKLILYLSFIILLIFSTVHLPAWSLLLSCLLVITAVNFVLHQKSGLNYRWYWSNILDIVFVFSIIFTGIAANFSPQRSWK